MGSNEGLGSTDVDVTKRYVRVVERRADGFVEFRFSIGEPSLFVEMLLGVSAFAEFCALNDVIELPPLEPGDDREVDDWDWTLHDAAHHRFR